MAALVNAHNISKAYGSLNVLDNLNLKINELERVVLLGPSGSGKTTFLRLLAGLDQPDQGLLEVKTKKIGFVFQEPRLIPWRSVLDNLRFVNDQGKIHDLLKQLRLSGFEDYLPSQLSGGMQQRVNLARALIIEPDLLILDEAFSSLDLAVKIQIMEDVVAMRDQLRLTIIAVTHDLKEALFLANRIIIFSARPARIAHDFTVKLPTDRKFNSPQLLAEEARLIEVIKEMV